MLKRFVWMIAAIAMLVAARAQAQRVLPGQPAPPFQWADAGQQTLELPKFNLDFPGGAPDMLIDFINEELKNIAPVNVIIPQEYNEVRIPAMKLKNVNVQQVFEALGRASQKTVSTITGYSGPQLQPMMQTYGTSYTFQATQPVTTNSVWYFVVQKPPQLPEEQKTCRFYQLGAYLEQGLSINDITTAIKAAYKMLGETSPPELNFHQETSLLIAVGSTSRLKLIDEALSQLPRSKTPEPQKVPKADH